MNSSFLFLLRTRCNRILTPSSPFRRTSIPSPSLSSPTTPPPPPPRYNLPPNSNFPNWKFVSSPPPPPPPNYSFMRKLGDCYMLVTISWALYSVKNYCEENGYEDTKRMLKAKFGWDTPVKQEDFQVKQSIAFGELITVLQKKEKWERELVELLKRKDKLEAELMEILFGKREKKESV